MLILKWISRIAWWVLILKWISRIAWWVLILKWISTSAHALALAQIRPQRCRQSLGARLCQPVGFLGHGSALADCAAPVSA
jgi:hypothetical protein